MFIPSESQVWYRVSRKEKSLPWHAWPLIVNGNKESRRNGFILSFDLCMNRLAKDKSSFQASNCIKCLRVKFKIFIRSTSVYAADVHQLFYNSSWTSVHCDSLHRLLSHVYHRLEAIINRCDAHWISARVMSMCIAWDWVSVLFSHLHIIYRNYIYAEYRSCL